MQAHGACVQAFGQDAEGADEQGPQGGADEAGANAEDGELTGYVSKVDFHMRSRERFSFQLG
jgi:hypothetical protein